MSLDASSGIAQEHLHAFHSTQFFFVTPFNPLLADIVARVIVVIVINFFLRDLCHIAQNVSTMVCGITADSAFSHVKAMETEQLFLKDTKFVECHLCHEQLLGIWRIARILVAILDGVHSLVKLLAGDAKRVAEVECVQVLHLTHHHHDVVSRLVVNE